MVDISKLILKKRVGDIALIAEIIGESKANTDILLKRTGAKKHLKAVYALAKVIEARESLIEEIKKTINK
jgi:hypothetical protein